MKGELDHLPERLLARLWRRRSGGTPLRTVDGRSLLVVYPGRPGPGIGPDFRDALLHLDGRLVRGDVELHRDARGWRSHGHHRDPRYNGVVLHGVGGGAWGESAALANGSTAPVVSLAPRGRRSYRRQQTLPHPLERLKRMGREELAQVLDEAGDHRFLERSEHFGQRFGDEGPEQALYRGLLEALGYSQNRLPFLELGQRLPFVLVRAAALGYPLERRTQVVEELLLGTSGLVAPGPAWRRLYGGTPMPREQWCLNGLRPGNHPARRLRGAAVLLSRHLACGLLSSLARVVMGGTPRKLLGALQVSAPQGEAAALIGASRSGDVAVNAVLPALHAFALLQSNAALAASCRHLFIQLPPLQENTLTREARRLLGENRLAEVIVTARRQQGLLGLYKEMLAVASG